MTIETRTYMCLQSETTTEINPRLAVYMPTFEKGADDLVEHPPLMNSSLPRWEALARTLRLREESR